MNAPKRTSGDDAALSNLLGAALGTPDTSRPVAQDDTMRHTGNTADHQNGWFAEIGQVQTYARHAILAGVNAAAGLIKERAEDYHRDHGAQDPSTRTWNYPLGGFDPDV